MSRYWATSTTTQPVICEQLKDTGFFLEYNPRISMYRVNGSHLPDELMGYELHRPICINKVKRYVNRIKKGRK